jgi:isopentenyl-diphosphate delta-isomerase
MKRIASISQAQQTCTRKDEHLIIACDHAVEPSGRHASVFADVMLEHQALPEIDFDEIDTSTRLLGRRLKLPLLIGSMTGGTSNASAINRTLAQVAQETGIGMCLGSQRAMIEDPSLVWTYSIRDVAPDILIIANIGAVQLRKGVTAAQIEDAAGRIGADAIVFHLNAAQEAVQPEGDTGFAGLADAICAAAGRIGMPCGVKEVGNGFSRRALELLADAPLAFMESAGAGGTSWPLIEALRGKDPISARVGRTFADWGIDALSSLDNCLRYGGRRPVIASGGVRTGLDAARAIARGAAAVAMALPFVRGASQGIDSCRLEAACFEKELRVAMFLSSSRGLAELPRRVAPPD